MPERDEQFLNEPPGYNGDDLIAIGFERNDVFTVGSKEPCGYVYESPQSIYNQDSEGNSMCLVLAGHTDGTLEPKIRYDAFRILTPEDKLAMPCTPPSLMELISLMKGFGIPVKNHSNIPTGKQLLEKLIDELRRYKAKGIVANGEGILRSLEEINNFLH